MDKIKLAKLAANLVVGVGTSKIVSAIIKNNVSVKKITDQVTIVTAGFVLGSMASDLTKDYTDRKIDELVTKWYEFKDKNLTRS